MDPTPSGDSSMFTMPFKDEVDEEADSSQSGVPVDHRRKRRNRTTHSCLNCHSAKRKCDRKRPCTRCVQLGITAYCAYEVDGLSGADNSDVDETTRLKRRIAELEVIIRDLQGKPRPKWTQSTSAEPAQDPSTSSGISSKSTPSHSPPSGSPSTPIDSSPLLRFPSFSESEFHSNFSQSSSRSSSGNLDPSAHPSYSREHQNVPRSEVEYTTSPTSSDTSWEFGATFPPGPPSNSPIVQPRAQSQPCNCRTSSAMEHSYLALGSQINVVVENLHKYQHYCDIFRVASELANLIHGTGDSTVLRTVDEQMGQISLPMADDSSAGLKSTYEQHSSVVQGRAEQQHHHWQSMHTPTEYNPFYPSRTGN